jgi:hypothetical protein
MGNLGCKLCPGLALCTRKNQHSPGGATRTFGPHGLFQKYPCGNALHQRPSLHYAESGVGATLHSSSADNHTTSRPLAARRARRTHDAVPIRILATNRIGTAADSPATNRVGAAENHTTSLPFAALRALRTHDAVPIRILATNRVGTAADSPTAIGCGRTKDANLFVQYTWAELRRVTVPLRLVLQKCE